MRQPVERFARQADFTHASQSQSHGKDRAMDGEALTA